MPWNSSPAFSAIDPARARLGRYIKAGVGPTGALVGATSSKLLQLGDEIYVKVKNADLVKKQLDFNFLRRAEEKIN